MHRHTAIDSVHMEGMGLGFSPKHDAQVRLVRPGTWKGIWSYALGPAEDALCVKAMQLKNAKTGASPAG